MELGQAVPGALADGAAATAAQTATCKARDQLSNAAVEKEFRDACGIIPDLGCRVQYAATEALVRRAMNIAKAKLALLATATAPRQQPLPKTRQQPVTVNNSVLKETASKCREAISLQFNAAPDIMKDPRYGRVRKVVTCKPTASTVQDPIYSFRVADLHLRPSTIPQLALLQQQEHK